MKGIPEAMIYIGNIDETVTEKVLYEILIQAGTIIDFHFPQNEESKKSKGFAFASYGNEEEADYAVRLFSGLVVLGGKRLNFQLNRNANFEEPAIPIVPQPVVPIVPHAIVPIVPQEAIPIVPEPSILFMEVLKSDMAQIDQHLSIVRRMLEIESSLSTDAKRRVCREDIKQTLKAVEVLLGKAWQSLYAFIQRCVSNPFYAFFFVITIM